MAVKKTKAKKKKVSKKRGAPSKFDEKLIPVIKNLMKKGYYDYEVAELLGVDDKTLGNWKKAYPELFLSEGDWKLEGSADCERAMVKLAKGYELRETKVFMTKSGTIETFDVIKQLPPNEKALEFVLNNRDPDRWKNKVEHSIGEGMEKEFTLNYKPGDSKKKEPKKGK